MPGSGSYRQVDVKCPFYSSDDGKSRVRCEGICDESSLSINFRRKSDFVKQMDVFCCDRYKNCEVYCIVKQKYE